MKKEGSQLKAGIVLNYLNMGLGNLIPIFYTPIMLELLGQSEYGLYKLSSSITSYLSLISLGIGSAITRYLIKSKTEEGKEAEERIFGLFMTIFRIIAVAAFLIGTILTMCLDLIYAKSLSSDELARMKILVFLMVCNTSLSFAVSPYISVATAHEQFIFIQCMNIISTCVAPIVNLILLYLGYASIGMASSSLVICLIINICYLLYVRKKIQIKPQYKNIPFRLLKEILTFSFWIFLSNIVSQLYNSTDTIMIGMIPALATTGVAVYNVGGTFNSIVLSLTTGISSLLSPKTNKMVFSGASNRELSDFAIKIGRLQCYIATLIISGFIAFGRPFIYFYAGEDYAEAYWVAILMMIPNVVPLIQSVFLSIIIAKNKHKFRSIVYLGIAILNVIGTWVLMQNMGIIGAALMTGLALILGQGLAMNIYYKKIGLDIVGFWKKVLPIFIFPVLICAATLLIAKYIDFYNIITLLFGIVIYTIVFCIANWLFMMNPYEKSIILEPFKKIMNRKSVNKSA